jgi:hypothetical protein
LADILRRRSANTAATRYKVMRVLYRWLEEEEELPNPMARMKPPIIPERPIPIVPTDGLRRLLNSRLPVRVLPGAISSMNNGRPDPVNSPEQVEQTRSRAEGHRALLDA